MMHRYNPEPPDYDDDAPRRRKPEEPDDYEDDSDDPAADYRYDPLRDLP